MDNKERLRAITNTDISDMSVDIRGQYKDISPLIFGAKWVDDEASVVSVGNPTFGIIEDERGVPEVEVTTQGKRLKTFTMGAKCTVSNSLLKNSVNAKYAIKRAFAIGTAQAIEYGLFFGDGKSPTITTTGTVKTIPAGTNIALTNLIDMYKALDPVCLDGAHWKVSKDVRDIILLAKMGETSAEFRDWSASRLHFMGLPVFVNESFSTEKGIIAALVNPYDVTLRCTLFDGEQETIELTDISATNNHTTFLSIFDMCGVVDKADSAIILKVEAQPTISIGKTEENTLTNATKTTKARKAK